MFTKFIFSESGAVTVDWVVLTGGVVGMGLAVMAVASGGVESLSTDTAEELAGTSIATRFAQAFEATGLLDTDFSGGMGDFLGGEVVSLAGFGDVLQLGPGEGTSITMDVPAGATSATVSFDMIGGDDLDSGDTATVMINGQAVSFYTDDHSNVTIVDGNVPGVTVSVSNQEGGRQMGAGSHGHDTRATYSITVDNPGDSVTLGVHSSANEATSNEFYAIDNVNVVAN